MVQGHPGPERRKSERTKSDLVAKYAGAESLKVLLLIGGQGLDSDLLDLSEGGMAVNSKFFMPAASEPLVKFILLTRAIIIEGRIINKDVIKTGGYRLAIRFEGIGQQDFLTLSNFLKNVANREKTPKEA